MLAAARIGARSHGFDCNPIALMIARFRTCTVEPGFEITAEAIMHRLRAHDLTGSVEEKQFPVFDGAKHWFSDDVRQALSSILAWRDRENLSPQHALWFDFSLSKIVNRISRQDSETRYVAREKNIAKNAAVSMFLASLAESLVFLNRRGPLPVTPQVSWGNTTKSIPMPDESVDVVVTSPPYANTMDYYLYHKQRMNVLGHDFKHTQRTEIGSRWEFSSLRRPAKHWDAQFENSVREMKRILKPGGRCVLIIGDSQIAGQLLDASALTQEVARLVGFAVLSIDSVPMESRSRSFSRAFQRPNKNEHTIEMTRNA